MKRSMLFGLALLAACTAWSQRAVVTKEGEGKIGINLGAYQTGGDGASRTFLAVLKADLNRSGYLTVVSSGGEVAVVGRCVPGGGQLVADCQVYQTATRRSLLGKRYNAPENSARGLAHQVADEIIFAVTGKPGMASGKITLVGNRTGRKEIYICDMDGQNMRQVTSDRSIAVGPRWTPDLQNLTYTSYKRGYPNVFMTGRAKPLSSYGGLNASGAVSPNGKSMALILSKDGNPELYVMGLGFGGGLERLTRTRQCEASPCWSPDGNHIVYVSDSSGTPQIYILPRQGGQPMRLTTSGTENVAPDWGKNGYIVYSSRVGGRYRIMIANPVNRTVRELETDWADYEDPSWAPDGRHIVCSRTSGYRSSIYLLDTQKDSPIPLVSGSGDWYSPSCSP